VGILDGMRKFWNKQKTNFKVMIARDSLTMFSGRRPLETGMGGYDGIFLSRLGASVVQIGFINGIMSLLNTVLGVPSGWLIDNSSDIRKLYFRSFALSLPALLGLYFISDWRMYLGLMLVYTVALSIQFPAQLIIDIDSMDDANRVSGLGFHRTLTAIAGVSSPMLIAYAVNYFGGLESADSIRPLFLLFFAADLVILYIITQYTEPVTIHREEDEGGSLLDGIKAVVSGPMSLKLILFSEISTLFVMMMTWPFMGIYQVDIKTASIFIFGWIGVAEPAIDIFFSMPIANLVEKYGRKKTSYIGHVFGLIRRLVLVLTPASLPVLLVLVSVLGSIEGCLYVGMDAYSQEIVPQKVRGSYTGLRNLLVGFVGIASPVIGGYIWNISPDILFWIPVVQWGVVAFPILVVLMERYSKDGFVVQ
jgi:hypothetical protein